MQVTAQARNTAVATESATFSREEAEYLFDATARRYLNISGEEFLRRWDAGEYSHSADKARAMRVAMLIPLVRKTSARKQSR